MGSPSSLEPLNCRRRNPGSSASPLKTNYNLAPLRKLILFQHNLRPWLGRSPEAHVGRTSPREYGTKSTDKATPFLAPFSNQIVPSSSDGQSVCALRLGERVCRHGRFLATRVSCTRHPRGKSLDIWLQCGCHWRLVPSKQPE